MLCLLLYSQNFVVEKPVGDRLNSTTLSVILIIYISLSSRSRRPLSNCLITANALQLVNDMVYFSGTQHMTGRDMIKLSRTEVLNQWVLVH